MLENARDGSGKALFNSPEFVNWFVGLAREANPMVSVVGGGGTNPAGINDEIASLEKEMGNKSSDYYKGARSPKSPGESVKQVRYRELIEARDRMQARGQAA
jgi:hypothetical protein